MNITDDDFPLTIVNTTSRDFFPTNVIMAKEDEKRKQIRKDTHIIILLPKSKSQTMRFRSDAVKIKKLSQLIDIQITFVKSVVL